MLKDLKDLNILYLYYVKYSRGFDDGDVVEIVEEVYGGSRHGKYLEFNNGRISYKQKYKNGYKHGFGGGELFKAYFKNGRCHGQTLVYNDNGELTGIYIYKKGVLITTFHYK